MNNPSAAERVAQARRVIGQITPSEAHAALSDERVLFVDIRDSSELSAGMIEGAYHCPRGGLEFAFDATSDLGDKALLSGRRLVFVCGSGGRAALATKLAGEFGLDAVCLEGGMRAWKAAGLPAPPPR
jgi:rhodanese-related sulfurtransferase